MPDWAISSNKGSVEGRGIRTLWWISKPPKQQSKESLFSLPHTVQIFIRIAYVFVMKAILGLSLFVVLAVYAESFPERSSSRHKRGFRQSVVDRIGHGFGKRTNSLFDTYPLETSRDFMSVEELADHMATNTRLAEAILRKFVDIDEDGIISTDELLGKIDV
ncbi:hypothetical protein ScPMuIL_017274 [Solemya velum]